MNKSAIKIAVLLFVIITGFMCPSPVIAAEVVSEEQPIDKLIGTLRCWVFMCEDHG